MEKFCGSSFWDQNVTWTTETPDFTECFQKTALVWVPCGFLWLLAPCEFYLQVYGKKKWLPWTGLTIFKLLLGLSLVGFSLAEMFHDVMLYANDMLVYPSDYYAGFVKATTYVLVCAMILLGNLRGCRTSGIQFIFWLLMSISQFIVFRSFLLRIFNDDVYYDSNDRFNFITITCTFPIVFGQLFLGAFADRGLTHYKLTKRQCPEDSVSFLSQITFWWINRLVLLGRKLPLTIPDMWELSKDKKSEVVFQKFQLHWRPKVAQRHPNNETVIVSTASARNNSSGIFFPALRTFIAEFLCSGLFKLIGTLLTFVNPLLLNLLINFIGGSEPVWRGFFYAALVFVVSMLESIFNCQSDYFAIRMAMKVRSCIISSLIRKALVLSSTSRKDYTVGNIINLMSVDTQTVIEEVKIFHDMWATPLKIVIALFMLWQQLGISTLTGLGIMILLIPVHGFFTSRLKNIQLNIMKEKDKRTKLMSEILNGIKVLKLYAWEKSFQERIMKTRHQEIIYLTKKAYFTTIIFLIFYCTPFLVSVGSFATYVLISSENVLSANKAFVSLSLFNILRMPFGILPMLITFTATFLVSLKRVNKFLREDELDPNVTENNSENEDVSAFIENGNFSWSKSEAAILKNINVRVKKGSLLAVVGQVGAGKSSLLSAFLGEMEKITGTVNVAGSVAYVPQQAWIQNTTLRKNILFTKEPNEKRYKKILEACALNPDLEILPGGDETEIGEKGINLSGGQKQRVSLARAVYNDADVYFLDDPLSAVDSHVSKDLFDNVISNYGLLRNKTRILVTHRLTVLPFVDCIIVMKDGAVTEMGSYDELLTSKGAFADFLIQYLTSEKMETADDVTPADLEVIEQIAATVGRPELHRQFSRLVSRESNDSDAKEQRKLSSQISQISQVAVKMQKSVEEKKVSSKSKLIETEAVKIGSVKWDVYTSYIRACGLLAFSAVVVIYLLSSVFIMASRIWLSVWSNDALDPTAAGNTALRNLRLGVYGALGFGEILFTLFGALLLALVCLRAARLLHDQSLDRIFRAPMSFFDTTPMGRILNRFSKDVDTIDNTIRMKFNSLILTCFGTVSSIVIISLQSALILVAIVPLGLIYYIVQSYYIATSRQLTRLESVSKSPIFTHFSETISGSASIRAYGVSDKFISQSNVLVDTNNSCYFPMVATNRWLEVRLEFLGYCITFLAALFAVLAQGTISPGLAGLAISNAMAITVMLNGLVRATSDLETNIVSVERCLEYTRTPTEASRFVKETEPSSDWPKEGCINFDGYATRYREGLDLVLKGITCTIRPMEKVGIVGRTGAGKSSLTLSLFRLIEAAGGCISIDGVDISKLGLYSLRSKLTVIPQDPVLFAGSLRLNLDPFEEHSDEQLWEVLEHAHLKTFVASLERGLQHEVIEGGENLSVGQRQLLCLGRALLRKSKILVMDEATAAVDMETDDLIQLTIRSEFADCTVLTIAHRLNTIIDYDRVIVLDNGEIIEYDMPSNLLKDPDSAFYRMARDANLV